MSYATWSHSVTKHKDLSSHHRCGNSFKKPARMVFIMGQGWVVHLKIHPQGLGACRASGTTDVVDSMVPRHGDEGRKCFLIALGVLLSKLPEMLAEGGTLTPSPTCAFLFSPGLVLLFEPLPFSGILLI